MSTALLLVGMIAIPTFGFAQSASAAVQRSKASAQIEYLESRIATLNAYILRIDRTIESKKAAIRTLQVRVANCTSADSCVKMLASMQKLLTEISALNESKASSIAQIAQLKAQIAALR